MELMWPLVLHSISFSFVQLNARLVKVGNWRMYHYSLLFIYFILPPPLCFFVGFIFALLFNPLGTGLVSIFLLSVASSKIGFIIIGSLITAIGVVIQLAWHYEGN